MDRNIPKHAVKAVICNEVDEILFLRRNTARGVEDNWDLPGGLIEPGESDTSALMREIGEELGVAAIIHAKLGVWSFYRPYDEQTVQVTNYKAEIMDGDIKLSDEHVDYKYFSSDELLTIEVKDPSIFNAL